MKSRTVLSLAVPLSLALSGAEVVKRDKQLKRNKAQKANKSGSISKARKANKPINSDDVQERAKPVDTANYDMTESALIVDGKNPKPVAPVEKQPPQTSASPATADDLEPVLSVNENPQKPVTASIEEPVAPATPHEPETAVIIDEKPQNSVAPVVEKSVDASNPGNPDPVDAEERQNPIRPLDEIDQTPAKTVDNEQATWINEPAGIKCAGVQSVRCKMEIYGLERPLDMDQKNMLDMIFKNQFDDKFVLEDGQFQMSKCCVDGSIFSEEKDEEKGIDTKRETLQMSCDMTSAETRKQMRQGQGRRHLRAQSHEGWEATAKSVLASLEDTRDPVYKDVSEVSLQCEDRRKYTARKPKRQ